MGFPRALTQGRGARAGFPREEGGGANHEEQAGGQRFPEGKARGTGNTGEKVKRPQGPVNRI